MPADGLAEVQNGDLDRSIPGECLSDHNRADPRLGVGECIENDLIEMIGKRGGGVDGQIEFRRQRPDDLV